jgi:hypothetical protein
MVYFAVYMTFNEIVKLKKALDQNCFCLLEKDNVGEYVGVVTTSCYNLLINSMSGECLLTLEYLEEGEFRKIMDSLVTHKAGSLSLLDTK